MTRSAISAKRQRPVHRRIAAAGDDHATAAEILPPPHQVEDALLLEFLDAGEGRPVRPERAGPRRDQHRAGGDALAAQVLDDKPVRALRQAGDGMPEVKPRRERRGLLGEPLDQFGGVDSRIARDVVDRLFRIERGALPARRRQRIEHMAAHVEHAAFEHREQADRAGADDRDIAGVGSILHRLSLTTGSFGVAGLTVFPKLERARRLEPESGHAVRAACRQILRLLACGIYKGWAMIVDRPARRSRHRDARRPAGDGCPTGRRDRAER